MIKKKIVFRILSFPVKSETFITNQIILAINLGYDVSILVTSKNELKDSSQPELVTKYGLLEKTVAFKKINTKGHLDRIRKIISLIIYGLPFKYIKTLNYFRYGKQGLIGNLLYQLFETKQFLDADLFHVQFGTNKYPFDSLKKHGLLKGKLITTFHGYDIHFDQKAKQKESNNYIDLFKSADIISCNTPYLFKKLVEVNCPEEKIKIIPVSVDTSFYIPIKNRHQREVLELISIGRLIKLKGYQYAIKAVAELVNKGYHVNYSIIGEGDEQTALENLIQKLNLSEYVKLKGHKNQSEIRDKLQNSDIYLMSSTFDETGRREAQGIVTGEAQACGLPVVAFRSGGVPYTIAEGETGFLSKENDYLDMAANIERLIKDEELRLSMGIKARKFVEDNFSQHHLGKIWKDVYSQLLNAN